MGYIGLLNTDGRGNNVFASLPQVEPWESVRGAASAMPQCPKHVPNVVLTPDPGAARRAAAELHGAGALPDAVQVPVGAEATQT